MSGHVVYDGVQRVRDGDDGAPTLFNGQKLWFAHTVPQRKWLVENARANGAVVVDMDTAADVRLVDHAKKSNPPGTYSYRYVESSIRSGILEELADHAVGIPSRVSRPVGSIATAPKSGRTPFTAADDQLLWNWVKPFMDRGGAWKGNEIYKQLEEANPRHTFQSWRDRWMKHTQYQKRQVIDNFGPQSPPPARLAAGASTPASQRKRQREAHDDGEVQRAEGSRPQRVSSVARPRSPPVQRAPRTRTYTSEDDDSDANEIVQEESLPETPGSSRRKARALKRSQLIEQERRRLGIRTSPAKTSPSRLLAERNGLNLTTTSITESDLSKVPHTKSSKPFTQQEYKDIEALIADLDGDVWNGDSQDLDKPWEEYAKENNSHTSAEWKDFLVTVVLPEYCEKNKRSVSEFDQFFPKKAKEHISDRFERQQAQEQISEASSDEGELSCAVCFTSEPGRWHQDRLARFICQECHKLVKKHGFRRASILQRGLDEDEEAESVERTDKEQTAHAKAELLRLPQKSTSTPGVIAGLSQTVDRASPERAQRTKSPSFRPQSPSTSLPPESNTSRKRSAGKNSQSQSTQPSNSSNTNSQNVVSSTQSRTQEAAPKPTAISMGQDQSKEGEPQPIRPPNRGASTAPTFQAPSNGKRKRLQDEPDTLPTQQDSSLSTDGAPPPQRSAHLSSSRSDKENDKALDLAILPTLTTHSGGFQTQVPYSPLFVPEDDPNDIEDDIHFPQLDAAAEDERASSQARIELVSEGHEINPDIQPTSEPENEDSEEDVDADFGALVPPSKRQRPEGLDTAQDTPVSYETAQETPGYFETAQEEQNRQLNTWDPKLHALPTRPNDDEDFDMTELPDPPGGFEQYGVGASIVPPDYDNNLEQDLGIPHHATGSQEEFMLDEEREVSPQIKVEYASGVETHDEPIVVSDDSSTVPTLEAERTGLALADQEMAPDSEQERVQNEGEQGPARGQREQRARQAEDDEVRWREEIRAQQEAEEILPQSKGKRRDEPQQPGQEPSSTTAINESASQAQSAPKSNPKSDPPLEIETWLAQQHARYPRTRALEPIIFRAAEATGFNFVLASAIVDTMLLKRDAHVSGLRGQSSRRQASTAELLALDVEQFLPKSMSGVWTKDDDHDLLFSGEEGQNRMWIKHGQKDCVTRFEFLDGQADSSQEE